MKRLNMKRITASSIIAGALAATGAFVPGCNQPETVYGPPEWFEGEGGEGYDPADNDPEEVYGPPEWFDGTYDPDENVPEVVYGPPEWFTDADEDADDASDEGGSDPSATEPIAPIRENDVE